MLPNRIFAAITLCTQQHFPRSAEAPPLLATQPQTKMKTLFTKTGKYNLQNLQFTKYKAKRKEKSHDNVACKF
jgi:hypothetical protein